MDGEYEPLIDKARKIIKKNNYLVLATVDKNNEPWASTISYVFDENYDFYFLSSMNSFHAKNITERMEVAFEIFDSTQRIGDADGVQGKGTAVFVQDKNLIKVIELYVKKFFPNSTMSATERYPPENYGDGAEYRFFKIKVSKLYVTLEDISVLKSTESRDQLRLEVDPKLLSQ